MVKRQETGTEAEDNNERGPWQTLATLHSLRVCVSIRGNDSHQGSAAHNRVQAGVHYTSRTHTHVPAGLQYFLSNKLCVLPLTHNSTHGTGNENRATSRISAQDLSSRKYELWAVPWDAWPRSVLMHALSFSRHPLLSLSVFFAFCISALYKTPDKLVTLNKLVSILWREMSFPLLYFLSPSLCGRLGRKFALKKEGLTCALINSRFAPGRSKRAQVSPPYGRRHCQWLYPPVQKTKELDRNVP